MAVSRARDGKKKRVHLVKVYGRVRVNLRTGPVEWRDVRVGTVDAEDDVRNEAHVGIGA